MKNSLIILILTLLVGCNKDQMDDCITSTGKTKIEYRKSPSYSEIELDDRINLDIIWDSIPSIKVEAGSGIIKNVITKVKDGKLEIYNQNKCNWVRSYKRKVKVTVSGNQFNTITYRGSGTINCINTLKPKILYLNCWEASGNVNLNFESDESYLKSHTGPTTVTAKGKSKYSVLYLGGVGAIHAENLVADNGYIVNANTGDIYQKTIHQLTVHIQSYGDVYAFGVPDTLILERKGKGEYIQR